MPDELTIIPGKDLSQVENEREGRLEAERPRGRRVSAEPFGIAVFRLVIEIHRGAHIGMRSAEIHPVSGWPENEAVLTGGPRWNAAESKVMRRLVRVIVVERLKQASNPRFELCPSSSANGGRGLADW